VTRHQQVKNMTLDDLRARTRLPVDDVVDPAGIHFAVLPMEGWDGTEDGRPTDLVRRRWSRFGASGAELVWGGEAFAVRPDGRANPRQLCRGPSSADDLAELRSLLAPTQRTSLQLTHSGRWSVTPQLGRHDPLLDARRDGPLVDTSELVDDYVASAVLARDAGFDFVDVKACHGYLLHELLGGDGPLEDRAALQREIITRIRAEGIEVGVRLSVFDAPPHDRDGRPQAPAPWGFDEPIELLDLLEVDLVCVTAGSPYYCPHVQRPAFFPPSDGYQPPEDPLLGVERLVDAALAIKRARPERTVVASGLSYLQELLPNVASALGREVDHIGLGRMMLAYHDLPADVLAGRPLDRRRLCRTFSDCTTAPRNGLVSGCYPLDDHYKSMPERRVLVQAKRGTRR
jgi:2,4-dienoyl-CoA reductase-like NADH-dependent reductase (Old Yellow Enzyme family)